MPTINIQADISIDVLVKAAAQLSEAELRQFTSQVLELNAKRTAPSITQEEAELLLHINDRLPEAIQQHYRELMAKRDAETLGAGEYAELLALTAQAEAFDVRRVEALSKLASRRGVTLTELMRQLGLEPPSDV